MNLTVVIPTCGRKELHRALTSVWSQTLQPNAVLVVGDADDVLGVARLHPTVRLILNERTAGLSGAVNTALGMLACESNPKETFVAFLDDDDEWLPDYLASVAKVARDGADIAYAGILRQEAMGQPPIPLGIPRELSVAQFLVGNPNVQGSNLVVRLSHLLLAGGFDEALPSTTDRDIMIRLLDIPAVKAREIPQHLVIHHAECEQRLSDPGSEKKLLGLTRFYLKHQRRMDETQKRQFCARANEKFGWRRPVRSDERTRAQSPPASPITPVGPARPFRILVAFSSLSKQLAQRRLTEIANLRSSGVPISDVILIGDFPTTDDAPILAEGFNLQLTERATWEQNARSGLYGDHLRHPATWESIAFGRTLCQHHVYEAAKTYDRPIVWLVDDDVILDNLWTDGGNPLSATDFVSCLEALSRDVDVGIGRVAGAPPLPAAATIRTQLLDLASDLCATHAPEIVDQDITPILGNDSYYDLSTAGGAHLEFPARCTLVDAAPTTHDIDERLVDIAAGRAPSRPVLPTSQFLSEATDPPVCGGNRFIFDIATLRETPHATPHSRLGDWRRADTLWAHILKENGPRSPFRSAYRIRPVSIGVSQERDSMHRASTETLILDILGAALLRSVRAVPQVLRDNPPADSALNLACESFRSEAEKRLRRAALNMWRIRGLTQQITHLRGQAPAETRERLQRLQTKMDPEVFRTAIQEIDVYEEDFKNFLRQLPRIRKTFRAQLEPRLDPAMVHEAASWLRGIGHNVSNEILGHGAEGFVLVGDEGAIKVFYSGVRHFRPDQLEFLHSLCATPGETIATPSRMVQDGGRLAIQIPHYGGPHYAGGRILEILDILAEAHTRKLVHSNFCPNNLLVTPQGLALVDVGRSLEKWTDAGYREMTKRAYLTYRWWFRPDLPQLMRVALTDDELPELEGFLDFHAAISRRSMEALSYDEVLALTNSTTPGNVLDHGAGRQRLSLRLAEAGWTVDAYDPSPITGLAPHPRVHVIARPAFETSYDLVVSNMVLCEVSDNDAANILNELRGVVTVSGRAIVGICNPMLASSISTTGHTKSARIPYERSTWYTKDTAHGGVRRDRHRPLSWYHRLFREHGFLVDAITAGDGVDRELLAPLSEHVHFHLTPDHPSNIDATLLIKASAQDAQTVRRQVQHIVGQLVGPHRFRERVIVADDYVGPFARPYATPDLEHLKSELDALQDDGWVDRVVWAPKANLTIQDWFGFGAATPGRAANGQPTSTILAGLDACQSRYVFHADVDVIIQRDHRHDYLRQLVDILDSDAQAVTVTLPTPRRRMAPSRSDDQGHPWRVEARCGLLDLDRLRLLRPLPNSADARALALPWHRALDAVCKNRRATSWRVPDLGTSFVHVPNALKLERSAIPRLLQASETRGAPAEQAQIVDVIPNWGAWCGKRIEDFVFLVRGQDVPIPLLARCLRSLRRQLGAAGLIVIDAGSTRDTADYLSAFAAPEWGDRLSIWTSDRETTPMENIYRAITDLCPNPETIIAMVDADDQLIGPDALATVRAAYSNGADLTVGGMLRTDKHATYPINLDNPRTSRGGNVWQHLRTFKVELFCKVPRNRFMMNGEWVPRTEDWAYMVPMVELARKPVHIDHAIYWYEPRAPKLTRDRQEREAIIGHLMAQPRCT